MYKIRRFFDCQVPVNRCNFECDYCTVGQWRKVNGEHPTHYTPFKYSVEHMSKALTPERLGGVCAFNLCGNGETLLHPQLLDFAEALLRQGHFVSIVSNGTISSAIDHLCTLDEQLRSHIFIKFSFHYTELLKKNLLKIYFNNINKAHKAGLSLTVELVASDSNVKYIDEIKQVCMENLGVLCHLTDPRLNTASDIRHLTEMPMDEHLKIWSQFESALFDYRQATWGDNRQKYFCYGGVWSFNLALGSGKLKQCYRNSDTVQFIFDNIEEPIHFIPRGHHCSFAHCFNSHVFDCLCGVVPEIKSPFYIELRNRKLADGTEWIKEAYKDIYGHRICENNDEYSTDEKIFFDGIISLSNEKEPNKDFEKLVIGKMAKLINVYNVSFYGDGYIFEWMKKRFHQNDKSKEVNQKMMIIITDFANFAQLKLKIATEYGIATKIESIVDLLKL